MSDSPRRPTSTLLSPPAEGSHGTVGRRLKRYNPLIGHKIEQADLRRPMPLTPRPEATAWPRQSPRARWAGTARGGVFDRRHEEIALTWIIRGVRQPA